MKLKNKNYVNAKKIIIELIFDFFCLGIGFIIAYFGKNKSFFEKEITIAIITLFGFSLSSTIFIHQAFAKTDNIDTVSLIKALSKDLWISLILICLSICLDFLASIELTDIITLISQTIRNGCIIYIFLCQIDILKSFLIILKNGSKK